MPGPMMATGISPAVIYGARIESGMVSASTVLYTVYCILYTSEYTVRTALYLPRYPLGPLSRWIRFTAPRPAGCPFCLDPCLDSAGQHRRSVRLTYLHPPHKYPSPGRGTHEWTWTRPPWSGLVRWNPRREFWKSRVGVLHGRPQIRAAICPLHFWAGCTGPWIWSHQVVSPSGRSLSSLVSVVQTSGGTGGTDDEVDSTILHSFDHPCSRDTSAEVHEVAVVDRLWIGILHVEDLYYILLPRYLTDCFTSVAISVWPAPTTLQSSCICTDLPRTTSGM
ncbi:hypothetical protein BO71DRAFT_141076 [Aspergillus ellipticus CBS 707.79]|uniref:Uncharacterized protein n=1 Tax=Aspergillus ellipticus CBS 707.79 TaxID=1448320 RepID=A0A319DJX2_9EURO|nr:hypothetical protein BO71DRAFT_141076 [Aspergillus ellipticus CBS 707.79]